jgi:ABC-type dipeptide/oligopeptide/nickel transport system permease subunit
VTTTAVAPLERIRASAPEETRTRGLWSRVAHGTLRNPAGRIGSVMFGLMLLMALFGPLIAPRDPVHQDIIHRLQPPAWISDKGTTVLGTDQYGRDVASRLFYGAQVSLSLSLLVVLLACTLGVVLGLAAGLQRGWLEMVIMRLADSLLAVPFMVVAIAIIAVWGSGWLQLVALLTAFVWVPFARMVRADVLSAREKEYVEAARCLGAGDLRIALRHVLPNVISPVIVLATFTIAGLIIAESALSFLGVGIQPPTPSWGSMLNDGRGFMDTAWWLSVFPGLAITLTVMGANFLGDALRDVLDPRQRL